MSHLADFAALAWFTACWGGYTLYADRFRRDSRNLMTAMHDYRLRWMRRMLGRENRITDTTIMATTMRNVSLFASTTLFIVGGLVAVLGAVDQARQVAAEFPFVVQASKEQWAIKVIILMVVFVYAFFKFAWSLRQFNYGLVLIGAAPMPGEADAADRPGFAERAARVTTLAVGSFNRGVRAYYFGLAMLSWFIQPALFALAVVWVVGVIYRREFRSFTLETLTNPHGDPAQGYGNANSRTS